MSLNLNLTGFSDNPFGDVHNRQNGLMNTRDRAILYIFKPFQNQFGDVGLRPFSYRFDENFIASSSEIADLTKRGTIRHSSLIGDMMSKTNFSDYLMPSIGVDMTVHASQLNDCWRFMLILTETANSLINANTVSFGNANNNIRRIYNGYFVDEPFNARTLGSSNPTPNPNAFIVITHKTVVEMHTEHGPLGSKMNLNTTASESVFHTDLSKTLTSQNMGGRFDNELYVMTPENCVNSVELTDDGFSYSAPGAKLRPGAADVISDVLEQPTLNVGQVVRGVIKLADEQMHKREMMSTRQDRFFEDDFLDSSYSFGKISRHLALPTRQYSSTLDLDVNSRISVEDLNKLVNNALDVIPVNLDRPMLYETADQQEASMTNLYSFLIASVISPIMNSAGLNEMEFGYSAATRYGQFKEDFRILGAAASWPMDNDSVMRKANAVRYELTNGIFKTIHSAVKDFHVLVKANATGMTVVRLSLIGMGYRNEVDYEFPSCLGGLVSPLLGNTVANVNNSQEIQGLFNSVTGTQDVVHSFDSDDKEFERFANEFNYDGPDMYSL